MVTTRERFDYSTIIAVNKTPDHSMTPLNRDVLFVSIYESCKHRKNAITDAASITDTCIARCILTYGDQQVITRETLRGIVIDVLGKFDVAAAVYYNAHHPKKHTG